MPANQVVVRNESKEVILDENIFFIALKERILEVRRLCCKVVYWTS